MKLSLRYKILGLFAFLLLSSVALYTFLASEMFRQEKSALLFDVNHSVAVTVAAQLEASLQQSGERIRLYSISELLGASRNYRLGKNYLAQSGIFGVRLYQIEGERYLFRKKAGEIERLSLSKVKEHDLFWRDGEGRFYQRVPITTQRGETKKRYLAIAHIDASRMLEVLQVSTPYESFLVNSKGEVLVFTHESQLKDHGALNDHPLLERALSSKTSGVSSYAYGERNWFGAFAPLSSLGLFFVSQSDQSEVDSAIQALIQQSALFGLIVATIALLASILFSRRLTLNLARLTSRVLKTGEGDLETKINIQSRDEVGDLANSFNEMIQALKDSRDKIERYNRELEGKVADRTRELKEKNIALEELQEKLIKSTQLAAAGEVAGRTAHEVLNPLTAALARVEQLKGSSGQALAGHLNEIIEAWKKEFQSGGVDKLVQALNAPSTAMPGKSLLEEDLENLTSLSKAWTDEAAKVDGGLEFVEGQGQRIQRILDGMRELVRSSSAREVLSCKEVVEEAISSQSDLAERDGIEFVLEWETKNDLVEVNRDELIQILLNLFRNAMQALKPLGQGKIRILSKIEGEAIFVDVWDNGPGIPEEAQKLVFEQGYTTKSTSEGTGLGLAITRRYARAFGGEVELLFSEKGRGTCFRVRLPLKNADAKRVAV